MCKLIAQLFSTLNVLESTPSKIDKVNILVKNDSEYLRKFLFLTYNKFITYRIQQLDWPTNYSPVQQDIMGELEALCTRLAKHETGSNATKEMVKSLLSRCTEQNASWVARCITRDLNIGMDEKSINKAFPGLIPVFNCQLANKVEDWDNLRYPLIVEQKLDGARTIGIIADGECKLFSREGREFNNPGMEVIKKQLLKLTPGVPKVFDGEFIATRYNPANKTCKKNKDGNWPFAYGLSMLKSDSTTFQEVETFGAFVIWDVVDVEYFLTQGARGEDKNLVERKGELSGLFSTFNTSDLPNLIKLENAVCHSKDEVMDLFKEYRGRGWEGCMLKDPKKGYEFKRSNAVLKLKSFFNLDLRIVGVQEGTSKYSGMLGALLVADDTGKISTKVGSGFTDDDRLELWVEHLGGRLEGKIVEVSAQEVTIDGSLRFPTFVCMRDDKTTTNIEGMI